MKSIGEGKGVLPPDAGGHYTNTTHLNKLTTVLSSSGGVTDLHRSGIISSKYGNFSDLIAREDQGILAPNTIFFLKWRGIK